MNTEPISIIEKLITYISAGWGVVLVTNSQAFEKSNNFDVLQSIVHQEWILGVICLVLASVKVIGIGLRSTRIRWMGLLLSALLWIGISATFLMSTDGIHINTGFITYSGIAVMCLFASKEVLSK